MVAYYPTDAAGLTKKPDRGLTYNRDFDTVKFTSQAGYTKTRMRSRRVKREFDLTYTNINEANTFAITDFYDARLGDFESFIFELTHLNQTGNCIVKFKEGSLRVTQVAVSQDPNDQMRKFYTVNFGLEEHWD